MYLFPVLAGIEVLTKVKFTEGAATFSVLLVEAE